MKPKVAATRHYMILIFFIVVFFCIYLIESQLAHIRFRLKTEAEKASGMLSSLKTIITKKEEFLTSVRQQEASMEKMINFKTTPKVERKLTAKSGFSKESVTKSLVKMDTSSEAVPKAEEEQQRNEDWKLLPDVKLSGILKATKPPNPNFLFYNFLPKCGGSGLNEVMRVLQKDLKFNMKSLEIKTAGLRSNAKLVSILKKEKKKPLYLTKHHYYFNFKEFGFEQPTYINLLRDPITWFASRYYFGRYGWKHNTGCRGNTCKLPANLFNMTIDECVEKRHYLCTDSKWSYLGFICGNEEYCMEAMTENSRKEGFEMSKSNLMKKFFVVGIMEQYNDTMALLNHLMPTFFKGASSAWQSKPIQLHRQMSMTNSKHEMNAKSRKFFTEGPLKYEVKLYNFARKLFNQRLKYYNIESSEP